MSAPPQPPPYGQPPYGQPVYAPPPYGYQPVVPAPSTSGAAIVSLVFGILSYIFLPFIGSIVAIICGHVALGGIKRSGGRVSGSGMAIAGLVLGYLQIIGTIIIIAIAIVVRVNSGSTT